jgi:hypothetical protein
MGGHKFEVTFDQDLETELAVVSINTFGVLLMTAL